MTYEEIKREFSKLPPDVIISICEMMNTVIDAVKALTKEIEEIAKERAENG